MANSGKTANTKEQGFFGKMSSSFSGIIIGILLLFGGIFMLWTNEQKNVKNIKDVKELRDQVIDVVSTSVDSKNEGKLIATSGKLDYNEDVKKDDIFNVSSQTPVLVRTVEVYQWEEETSDDEKKSTTYKKVWSEKIIDSENFDEGHENKTADLIPYKSDKFDENETLKVGAFNLISDFIKFIKAEKEVTIEEGTILPEGYKVYNNKYITNSEDFTNPEIGDIRISYTKADYKEVSVLGKQIGDTIGNYTTAKNTNKMMLVKGTTNGAGMIDSIESANNMAKWIYRVLGSLLIIIAIGSILGPITTLIGYIPFLGNIVNSMIGVVSFLIGLSISLLIIAIAWFAARPIVSIILIAIIVGLIIALIYFKKTKAEKTNN
ncbi:MAG: TMEM43 family protein [bacterium]|nr:TMEM43 family protein [bacterium]